VDWLIVGLGNPGRGHGRDRHNAGFMVVEQLRGRWSLPEPKKRFAGLLSQGAVNGRDGAAGAPARRARVALLCPLTYMNDAGRSVGPARGSLRLTLERVIVVHDEIDLAFGEVRVKLGGGLAGHNGLKSVARGLGGEGFHRVRVGVGRPDTSDPELVASYVLAPFGEPPEEVAGVLSRACDEVERVVFAAQ
jgi:peptidyl-tRNA hydrolase, PTH1 family